MKILVFGHSDSDGSHLPNPADAWPFLLGRLFEEASGENVEIVHRLLFAGPTAASFLERQLETESPEAAIVATSTYGVLAQLISNRVRERFGARAAGLVKGAERVVARHPGPEGSRRAAAFWGVRRGARRLVGTSGNFSERELVESYRDCFRAMARHEEVHSIVLGGAAYTDAIWRMNPGSERKQDECDARFREMALEHRFDWLSHQDLLGGPANKLPYYQADGVHTNEESNRLVAEAMLPLLLRGTATPR